MGLPISLKGMVKNYFSGSHKETCSFNIILNQSLMASSLRAFLEYQWLTGGPFDFHINCVAEKNDRRSGVPIVLAWDAYCEGWLKRLFLANKITMTDIKRLLLEVPFDSPLLPLTVNPMKRKLHTKMREIKA